MKAVIYFDSQGESGNIFYILALVREELQKQQRLGEFDDLCARVYKSRSYGDALSTIREYVKLIDKGGIYNVCG